MLHHDCGHASTPPHRLLLDLGAEPNQHCWGRSAGVFGSSVFGQREDVLKAMAKGHQTGAGVSGWAGGWGGWDAGPVLCALAVQSGAIG